MEAAPGSRGVGRVRLAVATALGSVLGCVLLLAIASSPGARAGSPGLLPDLVTMGIKRSDIVVEKRGRHRFLRLSNTVGNRGTAPLDITRGDPGEFGDCADGEWEAVQRLFADENSNGYIDGAESHGPPADELPFGCMRFHDAPGHLHWHVLDFARYQLRRARTGKLIESKKVGFCVIDTEQPFPKLPGTPEKPYYPQDGGCGGLDKEGQPTPPDSEGLSIGWADVYFFGLPGQSLEITKLRRGRYCLISKADPTGLIAESDDSNNTHTVRLKLRPRKLRFKKLHGPCRF
jgi:Lysyl oxidase